MKRLFVLIVGLVTLVAAALVLALVLGPRDQIVRGSAVAIDGRAVAEILAAREAAFDDITPGAEARVIWAGQPEVQTPLSILYLHGFSASSEEIRPVPDRVAEALGANLIFARLTGHGRDGDALAAAQAGDWVDDAALFIALARKAGERVLIIGTSAGGTLATYAATEPEMAKDVAGLVLISPSFQVANPAGVLMELGFARHYLPYLVGPESGFEPSSDQHARYWTTRYGSDALISLGTLMRETRARNVAALDLPVLVLFSDADQVVSAAATRKILLRWGGPVTLALQELPQEGVHPNNHVIAGDILSPAMTEPVVQTILNWVADSL
ncbi:alpha/beta hydrolase [Halochromatium roseum]|uniref:alpha/beta hydrolase n=1 Tax=Halochromatium roseum TaxID=391920 RepID=UPI00191354ED|nr:alpha/beta fold hydrolase [Halochromatium roseum]MBK5939625.1 hypothetical protein [Halochromatium roseum]